MARPQPPTAPVKHPHALSIPALPQPLGTVVTMDMPRSPIEYASVLLCPGWLRNQGLMNIYMTVTEAQMFFNAVKENVDLSLEISLFFL